MNYVNFNNNNIYRKIHNDNTDKMVPSQIFYNQKYDYPRKTPEKRIKSSNIKLTNPSEIPKKPLNFRFNRNTVADNNNNNPEDFANNNFYQKQSSNLKNNKSLIRKSLFNRHTTSTNRESDIANNIYTDSNSYSNKKFDFINSKLTINNNNSIISKNEINDNVSINSKYSNYSKLNNPLKPIDINNKEHYNKVIQKKNDRITGNKEIISNYINSLENIKKNVCSNINKNFKERIYGIWKSYLQEQKNISSNGNILESLVNEVLPIQLNFSLLLFYKINIVCEEHKKLSLNELYHSLNVHNSKGNHAGFTFDNVLNNEFNKSMNRNVKLTKDLSALEQIIDNEISQIKEKYTSTTAINLENYKTELEFNYSRDQAMVNSNINYGINYLKSKINSYNNILSFIKKNNYEKKIKALERELQQLKN